MDTLSKIKSNLAIVNEYVKKLFPTLVVVSPMDREVAKLAAMKDSRWIKIS